MAVEIPFNNELVFEYGQVDRLSPGIRRLVCRNPGNFTLYGTGSFIVGNGRVAIVDPGPADETHIDALLKATAGETISHILVTHTHIDHSPGCRLLQQHCDAPTLAMGVHGLGRLSSEEVAGGDMEFVPDRTLEDGELVSAGDWSLECVYTPGHCMNHMSFAMREDDALLCGDVVMGWSTTIVSPPDGNMKDYMQSLERLLQRQEKTYHPSHGPSISEPLEYVRLLHAHRMERIDQVRDCIAAGHADVMEMVPLIYTELDQQMYGAAARSVLASIEYLIAAGEVKQSPLSLDSRFVLA